LPVTYKGEDMLLKSSLLVTGYTHKFHVEIDFEKSKRKPLLTSIVVFVGLNLVYGMKGGIDNSAHVGGLIIGLLIGYIFYPALRRPAEAKFNYGTLAVVAVLFLSASAFIYKKLPNDMAVYHEKMSSFSDHEKAALAYFKMPYGSTHEDSLNALTKTGIGIRISN
jgi:rhomboid protease GluP